MCSLAICTWILVCLKDINNNGRMCGALRFLTTDSRVTVLSFGESAERHDLSSLSINQLSVYRWGAFSLISSIRLALSVFLLYYGSLFLVYTISLGDLLLNAVALEIILTMDELLYELLAPGRVKRLIAGALPLKQCPALSRTWRGLGLRTFVTLVLSFVTFFGVYFAHLSPQIDTLVRARDAL